MERGARALIYVSSERLEQPGVELMVKGHDKSSSFTNPPLMNEMTEGSIMYRPDTFIQV